MKISELRSLIRKHHKESFEPLNKLNKKGLMDYASKNGLLPSEPIEVEKPKPVKSVEKPTSKVVFGQPDMKAVQSFNFPQKKVAEAPKRVVEVTPKRVAEVAPKRVEKPTESKPKSAYNAFVSAEMKSRPAGVSVQEYMREIAERWRNRG